MILSETNHSSLPSVGLEELVSYLRNTGWKEKPQSAIRFRVFEGPKDDHGKPLTVALPLRPNLVDTQRRISDVLRTLSMLEDKDIARLIRDVTATQQDAVKNENDLLVWRIPHVDGANAGIPLEVAAEVVSGLYNLLKYSASAEAEPRPYFSQVTPVGKEYAEKCMLRATRPGSFIFEVESPVLASLGSKEGQTQEPSFPRRVVARLARGLQYVNESARQKRNFLIEQYDNGLNANLYETLRDMLIGVGDFGLEFRVEWSPVMAVPNDLNSSFPISLTQESIDFLTEAARFLRKIEVRPLQITGLVSRLGSSYATAEWTVVISANIEGQKQRVHVTLNEADYRKACDAHRDGKRVEVGGFLEKAKRRWLLLQPHDFVVSSE